MSRSASWRSGESSAFERISRARTKASCRSSVALELEPDAVVEVALGLPEPLLEAVGRIGRILPRREHDDADLEALAVRPLHAAQRRILAGRVGVEAEIQTLRQPRELAEMVLGQRRSHRGDDRLEPCLPQRDHVGVALDDHRPVLLRDRRPGEVEPVENSALLEQLALGRVDVLSLERVVVVELPGLEADHPAARIREREHQPRREVVVAALVGQPCGPQLVRGEPLLARLGGEPRPRREAEPELLRDVLTEPATREIRADGLAVGPFPQVALEERRRLVEHGVEALALATRVVGLRRALLVLERDPEPLGEPLDRADEVEALRLAHEGDDVAALAAAEAVVEVQVGVDGEARRTARRGTGSAPCSACPSSCAAMCAD